MIKRLTVKNYALIQEADIRFSDKLSIITGETGAGKSILLGALGLIMGQRADTKALYDEEQKCVVEAYFDISPYDLKPFFEENDLDYEPEIIIRREIAPSGKSRAFVNDLPVTLKVLQELSDNLIDLHKQFDTLDINNADFQMRMIDALANNKFLLEQYRQLFRQYSRDRQRLQAMVEKNQAAAREMEFLQYQLEEFHKAELQAGEQDQLESEQKRLSNAEDIKRLLGAAFNLLSDSEQAIIGQLQSLIASLSSLREISPDIRSVYERLNSVALELEDLSPELERISEEAEYDPERLGDIQQRLDLIYKLQKKHQVADLNALLAVQTRLETELAAFSDLGEGIEQLRHDIAQQEKELFAIAKQISERRHEVGIPFEEKVKARLALLAMEHARLRVDIQDGGELSPNGTDLVQFLFAPNKGSKFQSIRDVASGGELSRLALCIKSLVASAIPLPTLIFDEIDSGISGDVALRMGEILQHLSDEHQVICITHSPQIAAQGSTHFFAQKDASGERTVSRIRALSTQERIREIAVMLSSNPPSAAALDNARSLLKST